jgi:hypothetical protein
LEFIGCKDSSGVRTWLYTPGSNWKDVYRSSEENISLVFEFSDMDSWLHGFAFGVKEKCIMDVIAWKQVMCKLIETSPLLGEGSGLSRH